MASGNTGNIPPQRREVVVRGDGNCFTELLLFGGMKMSDEKHEEIHRLRSFLIEKKNPTVSEPLLFSTKLCESPITY